MPDLAFSRTLSGRSGLNNTNMPDSRLVPGASRLLLGTNQSPYQFWPIVGPGRPVGGNFKESGANPTIWCHGDLPAAHEVRIQATGHHRPQNSDWELLHTFTLPNEHYIMPVRPTWVRAILTDENGDPPDEDANLDLQFSNTLAPTWDQLSPTWDDTGVTFDAADLVIVDGDGNPVSPATLGIASGLQALVLAI